MVVHRSRWDSRPSRPVGIFPHGPIQGDAPGHKNNPGGLPTAVIQHPMGSCVWRVARRTLVSGVAVIGRSHLCMVASAASDWLHRRCCSVNLWFVLSGISTESLAIASESHAGGTRARDLGTLHKWTGDHLVSLSDDVCSDIGSWAFGRRWGRHPLSPISPGKTVEGALGGGLCAMAMGGICALVMGWPYFGVPGLILGALVALIAMVGDLTESMMKRDAGVKDSGDVLPGHGGILDRIDSYLFTPAVVYYIVALIQPLLVR